jgi:hypothetical protein
MREWAAKKSNFFEMRNSFLALFFFTGLNTVNVRLSQCRQGRM